MYYIFLDESGDLGFDFTKKRTSKYFIITLLICTSKREIEKVIEKVTVTKKKSKQNIFHSYHESTRLKIKAIQKLSEKDIRIATIYLNKSESNVKLPVKKHELYNLMTSTILGRIFNIKFINAKDKIILFASQKDTNKFLNTTFQEYLQRQINKKYSLFLDIQIKKPYQERGLQAADLISWAIFRKYQFNDYAYHKYIELKIIEEIKFSKTLHAL